MNNSETCESPFLIIAGVTKAGTTSLFKYLETHPQVSPCRIKEPYFFLPPGVPVPTEPRLDTGTLNDYLALFCRYEPGRTRLEASPMYFRMPNVERLIARYLPNARIVISLREPLTRLASHYRMAMFYGWLPAGLSFDAYVKEMFSKRGERDVHLIYRYPLEEGLYAQRLGEWQAVLGRDRILTVWFDDLREAPQSVASRIAGFAGLDPAPLQQAEFTKENAARSLRGRAVRDAVAALATVAKRRIRRDSAAWRALRQVRRHMDAPLQRLTTGPARELRPKAATIRALKEFYASDANDLQRLIGQAPPWAASEIAGRGW